MSTPLRDFLQPQERLANAVTNAFDKQQRILVVGTKSGNLPQWVIDHPLVVQWPGEGSEVRRAVKLPENVSVVLFLRFVGHHAHDRITKLATNGCYAHPELLSTGEVRRLLQPHQPQATPSPEATPPPAPPVQKWGGSLFGFVETHYEYGTEHGHQKAEAERLLRLAYAQGLTSTLASLTSTVSSVHRTIERAREEARLAAQPPVADIPDLLVKELDPSKVVLTPVEAGKVMAARGPLPLRTPTLTVSPGAQAELERVAATLPNAPKPSVAALVDAGATNAAQVDTSVAELLRMLDDAVAVLGLAREQLVALSAQNTAMKTSHAALRARVLGVLDGM